MAEWAVRAEHLGFDSVWISDHFLLSLARYGGSEQLRGSLEPMTALAALAARTSRVRLGTLVLCAPFRHPSLLAKMASTIDLLSGGRSTSVSERAGSKDEFERFGYEFGSVRERFASWRRTSRSSARSSRRAVERSRPPVPAPGRGHAAARRPAATPAAVAGVQGRPPSRSRLAARLADGWNTAWRWDAGILRAACVGREGGVRAGGAGSRHRCGAPSVCTRPSGRTTRDLAARFGRLREWMPGLDDQTPESFAAATSDRHARPRARPRRGVRRARGRGDHHHDRADPVRDPRSGDGRADRRAGRRARPSI